jgi:hypothetical protein
MCALSKGRAAGATCFALPSAGKCRVLLRRPAVVRSGTSDLADNICAQCLQRSCFAAPEQIKRILAGQREALDNDHISQVHGQQTRRPGLLGGGLCMAA